MLEWKKHYSGQYAVLLEGARRVGKSTIAENFAKNEYKSYILISKGSKVNAFEIKSSGTGKHESIKEFYKKFSKNVHNIYLLSQKDIGQEENLMLKPFYLMPFILKN